MKDYRLEQIEEVIRNYKDAIEEQGSEYGRKCEMESAFNEILKIMEEDIER